MFCPYDGSLCLTSGSPCEDCIAFLFRLRPDALPLTDAEALALIVRQEQQYDDWLSQRAGLSLPYCPECVD